MTPKTSPHSSPQEKKFVTWNSLWKHPRLRILPQNLRTRLSLLDWFRRPILVPGSAGRSQSATRWTGSTSTLSIFMFACVCGSLVTRPKYPPYRETGVAIRLSHCVSCGIADHRYTPTSFHINGLSQSKDRSWKEHHQKKKKLASEAYRAIGDVARNSIANRAIVGQ